VFACGVGCSGAPNEGSDLQQQAVVSSVSVLTQHNDLNRTGANLQETELTTTSVASGTFGKLFSRAVDGQIYAQPLYVGGGIGTHNVVYVATEHNSVYAFDADDMAASAPLWQVNLGTPVPSTDMTGCVDLTPEVGISGTPVIDPASKTLYVVAKTKVSGAYAQTLHALDTTTGVERPGSPVTLTATVNGTGGGSVSGHIAFDPFRQHNRAGLTLVNGVVHIAFASHCDAGAYHGWVLSYNASTLAPVSQYVTTPNGTLGGIWMAGEGLGADPDGSLYFLSGNGTSDTSAGTNLGMAAVKLKPNATTGQLATSSWFIPWNQSSLNSGDLDLGSGGAVLIPGTRLLVGGGKEGVLYLLNRDAMGGFQASTAAPHDTQIPERWSASGSSRIASSPVYWAGPTGGRIYVWPVDAPLRSFGLSGSTFEQTGTTGTIPSAGGFPGGALSISANGATHGSGILWATRPNADANHNTSPGTLYALDAEDITHVLWNSNGVALRDAIPQYAKFSPPTVANGKVYLATFANALYVYGLNAPTTGGGGSGSGGASGGGGAPGGGASGGGASGSGGGQPTDWNYVYTTYFAGTTTSDTPGHCGECHGDPVNYLGGIYLGLDKATFYGNLVRLGFVDTTSPTTSRFGDPASSPLAWFGTTGIMPADLAVPNAAAAAAVRGWVLAGAPSGNSAPFGGTPAAIPGTLFVYNFDTGGEGIAYHDNEAANLGGAYRTTEGVDIEGTSPSYDVGYTNAGEWLSYTVNVQTAGLYNITASVAAPAAGSTFHLANSSGALGTFSVPNTGAWTTYQNVKLSNVSLNAGQQVIQLFEDTAGFNIRSLVFALAPSSTPFSGSPVALPGTVFAYNYDNGGEGVAYHDSDAVNQGGAGRTTEGVDVEGAPTNVGWTAAGEWLNYGVNAVAGTYDITASVASTTAGNSFHLLAGTLNLGTFSVPNTGAWTTFTNVTLSNVLLSAGQQILTLVEDTGGFNVASLAFVSTTRNCMLASDCDDNNPCTVDICNGSICSSVAGNAGTVCRAAAGVCDVAETCTGSAMACPADSFVSSATVCRAAAGVCDQAESCTGNAAACPADALKASGTVCRAAANQCDVIETCSGLSNACPVDGIVSNGTACNDGNASTCSDVCSAGMCAGTTCTSSAYGGTPRSITTTIQAEDYDTGGEGAGYHDADATNQGAAYRMDGVDVQACSDAGAGYNVGWTLAGEWLDYSVTAATAGSYSVSLRIASMTAGQTMHLEMDGANVTGPIAVPNTTGWQTFQTINLGLESYLTAGNHVLRVVFDTISATSGGINLNWFTFTATPGPYGGTIRSLTSTIQAEDYDLGGEGIGYHDQEAANQGGAYRTTEGVDVQATTDTGGGFNVGYIAAGEWLMYSTSSATPRAYTVNLRVATLTAQTLHVEVDGVNVSGPIALPATGAWQSFQTVSKALTADVTAGNHLVRVVFDSGGVNLNWLSFN